MYIPFLNILASQLNNFINLKTKDYRLNFIYNLTFTKFV